MASHSQVVAAKSTHTNSLSTNSFSFALQNVIDHIPQRVMPRPASPVLELASHVAHDDVHSDEVEQLHLKLWEVVENPKVSDVSVALSSQVDVGYSSRAR